MSEEDGVISDELRHVIEQRVREKLPAIQEAIQTRTGKKLPENILLDMLADPMADVAAEVTIEASYAYTGPMPSPEVMRGYAEIFAGAPEQLFRQFEEEQKHRHQWENNALKLASDERSRRDLGAYVVSVTGLACAAFIAYLGAPTTAAILAGAIVLGGGALVLGRQFFASHGKDGTQVTIQNDGPDSHTDLGTRKTSGRRKKNNTR